MERAKLTGIRRFCRGADDVRVRGDRPWPPIACTSLRLVPHAAATATALSGVGRRCDGRDGQVRPFPPAPDLAMREVFAFGAAPGGIGEEVPGLDG